MAPDLAENEAPQDAAFGRAKHGQNPNSDRPSGRSSGSRLPPGGPATSSCPGGRETIGLVGRSALDDSVRIRGILPEALLHFMPATGRRAARGRAAAKLGAVLGLGQETAASTHRHAARVPAQRPSGERVPAAIIRPSPARFRYSTRRCSSPRSAKLGSASCPALLVQGQRANQPRIEPQRTIKTNHEPNQMHSSHTEPDQNQNQNHITTEPDQNQNQNQTTTTTG